MRKPVKHLVLGGTVAFVVVAFLVTAFHRRQPQAEDMLELYRSDADYAPLNISYPLD